MKLMGERLSSKLTVVGMVNGMIGGLILILPVLTLDAGWALSLAVLLVIGGLSFYSCYLCVIHMGDQADLDWAIYRHFNGSKFIKTVYDLCVWSNLILIDMLYFELIVIQWQGLLPSHHVSLLNPLVNAAWLLLIVLLLKFFEFGASTMAYGIASIASYLVFLVWVLASEDQSAPAQPFPPAGGGAVQLAAAMGGAYSIQSFFIPVLRKNGQSKNYVRYTLLAYLLGGSAYIYIAYMGAFGILHRQFNGDPSQQTLEGYFTEGTWEVNIIEGIYLVHLYSVFPQFLLISKKRMFGVFNLEQSHGRKINLAETIYVIIFIIICLGITLLKVKIGDIIDINGALIGFFFIYFLPALLHIKCMYFSKGKLPLSLKNTPSQIYEEQGSVDEYEVKKTVNIRKESASQVSRQTQLQEHLIKTDKPNEEQLSEKGERAILLSEKQIENSRYYCNCEAMQYTKAQRICDLFLVCFMVLLGGFIMINGLYEVFA